MERLTKKQKDFADNYLETGNATKSALKAYDTEDENVAAVIGSDNLRKVKIVQYLEGHGMGAATRLVQMSESAKSEPVKLDATKNILDRVIGKPVSPIVAKIEHSIYDEYQIEE
mgnify:CR=1 FL=1